MDNVKSMDVLGIELICVIVNCGHGSKILKAAKQYGVRGGTILLGRGTVKSRLLEFLSLYDVRKEIVLMLAEKNDAYYTLQKLDEEIHFDKPHHGIAFTIPVYKIMGTSCIDCRITTEGGTDVMYKAIFTIVEKGRAEDVIDAAAQAGSKGGTILNARGSGIHETSKLFSMEIEPEKEVVLILAEVDATEAIAASIRDSLKIEEPGNGIIFIQDVSSVYGIYR
ncbi:MAG: P-II family nitrogen regulator [Clostridiaceae bacterium]|nr:P-II family nitrogen regulator [Clostridiaceae bacterium]